MNKLHTNQIASMTEMRDPQKVLDRAGGKPVAVLKNSRLVGYFVPAEAAIEPDDMRYATMDEVMVRLARRREIDQPVLDWLKDR